MNASSNRQMAVQVQLATGSPPPSQARPAATKLAVNPARNPGGAHASSHGVDGRQLLAVLAPPPQRMQPLLLGRGVICRVMIGYSGEMQLA